jgi:hypothetical protein
MKCDSHASLLAHTFISPCFGHKPKARVATILIYGANLVIPQLEINLAKILNPIKSIQQIINAK